MPERRTRGPRTADEQAGDAARRTATLFEKLPSSPYADDYLKPLAVLLRFQMGTAYLDPGPRLRDARALAKEETRFHDVLRAFERDAELMPLRDALEVERLAENVRRRIRKAKERLALAATGDDA